MARLRMKVWSHLSKADLGFFYKTIKGEFIILHFECNTSEFIILHFAAFL